MIEAVMKGEEVTDFRPDAEVEAIVEAGEGGGGLVL